MYPDACSEKPEQAFSGCGGRCWRSIMGVEFFGAKSVIAGDSSGRALAGEQRGYNALGLAEGAS